MKPVKYEPENPDRKFLHDAGKAIIAIFVLILLAISPVVVFAVWRALL